MTNKNNLKICRVSDLDSARMLVWQGVDYLGMHLIDEDHLTLIETFKQINIELQTNLFFYNSVLVTKITDVSLLKKILVECHFKFLQLHVVLREAELKLIRGLCDQLTIKLILVVDPKIQGSIFLINKYSDLIIIDNIQGGTGQSVEYEKTGIANFKNILLAGGINNLNIGTLNEQYTPFGFDVQTYTEYSKGVKKFQNVFALKSLLSPTSYRLDIKSKTPILSLSITDIKGNDFDEKIAPIISQVDSFHLDHSSGYYNNVFTRNSIYLAGILEKKAKSKPYDIHLFITGDEFINTLDKYLKLNFRLHTAYFHIEQITTQVYNEIKELKKLCEARRIKLGVALQAGRVDIYKTEKFLEYIYSLNITEISVVGVSNAKSLVDYQEILLPLIKKVDDVNKKLNYVFSIAIDRDTTPERIQILSTIKFNKIISGKSILDTDEPEKIIVNFRCLLKNAQSI